MGIVIVILAAKVKEADIYDSANTEIKRIGNAAFYLMIIFACFSLVVSLLGGATAKWPKWQLIGCVRSSSLFA